MVGMTLIAIIMSVSLTSCSKDDPDGGDFTNEKKLVKIENTEGFYVLFRYDDKGRLIRAAEYDLGTLYEYSFIWGDGTIKFRDVTATIKNGLVYSEDSEQIKDYNICRYNQFNRLIKYEKEDQSIIHNLLWDGDKLISVTETMSSDYGSTSDITFTYEKTCKKGFNPDWVNMVGVGSSDWLYCAHPELLGLRTKQLPKSATRNMTYNDTGYKSSHTAHFSYEFDKDGYISKITIIETYEGETSTDTYLLTWE